MTQETRPNAFLLRADHRQGCWCVRCRNEAVDGMAQRFTLRQLNDMYLRTIPRRTEATLDQMFRDTIDKVVAGYSFQRSVLRGVATEQFGTWLANNTTLDVADRVKMNREMMELVAVFEDWEKIVGHLTDPRMINVECRRWSVNYFYRARSWKFCEDQQRIHNPEESKRDTPELFNQIKFRQLIDLVESSGILGDVSYDKTQAKKLSKKFDKVLQALCREKERQ